MTTSIGVFSERGGVVNVGLEEIMVMGAFSGLSLTLSLQNNLEPSPWISLLVAGIVGADFLPRPMQSLQLFSVRTMLSINFDIELDGSCLSKFSWLKVLYNQRANG